MWQGIRPKGLPSRIAVTPEQRTQIEASLNGLTGVVENVFYESQQDAYNRFRNSSRTRRSWRTSHLNQCRSPSE